jgi:hypothetical protein
LESELGLGSGLGSGVRVGVGVGVKKWCVSGCGVGDESAGRVSSACCQLEV